MSKIKIVAFDPALRNFGVARMLYDIEGDSLELESLRLIKTEKTKGKHVRVGSDDYSRAQQLYGGMLLSCADRQLAFAEIPSGTQSNRGAISNGISIGVLAACPIKMLEVNYKEVKLAAVGRETATKGEMIEWAMTKYPHEDWLMTKRGGVMVPVEANEHLADACAIAEAGIRTPEFRSALAILRGSFLS